MALRTPRTRILDIAKRAGVSHGTVSRVLNDKYIRCREQTRQKVLRIAAELNYHPDQSARSLKTRIYHTIGFLAYDITDAFVVDCIEAIEEYLTHTDYRALWLSAKVHASKNRKDLLEELRSLPIDGLIVIEADRLISDVELLRLHAREQMCITTLIRKTEGGHLSSVMQDNATGSRLLFDHLFLELGHRNIGFLYDPNLHPDAITRLETFNRLVQESDLPVRKDWILPTDGTVKGGYDAANKLLSCPERPTAIIAYNDLSAFGCIRACVGLGMPVPQTISVAGFDDIRMAAHYNPSLTTVASDYRALAKSAVNQIISAIGERSELFQSEHVVIQPKLVIRESTSAPSPSK